MAELDLDRITALSRQPPHILASDESEAGGAAAARRAVDLLAVMLWTGQAPRPMRRSEADPNEVDDIIY